MCPEKKLFVNSNAVAANNGTENTDLLRYNNRVSLNSKYTQNE